MGMVCWHGWNWRPSSGCSGCGSRGTCASGAAKFQVVSVHLLRSAEPGERVALSIPETSVVAAALLGYLLPPTGLLIGAIAAAVLFDGDLPAVLGAAIGLGAGLLTVRLATYLPFGRAIAPKVCSSTHHHPFTAGDPI